MNALTRISPYLDRRVLSIFLLGMASGLPIALIAGTLSWWLNKIGVSLVAIGLFSLVRMPYSLKFLWAPLIDRLDLPWLTRRLGRRRSWGIFIQILLMIAIVALGFSDPAGAPGYTALLCLIVGFLSASQDIVVDAYRIEVLKENEQGLGASAISFGWRLGNLISAGGAIALSAIFDWSFVYMLMALCLVPGLLTFLFSREPKVHQELAKVSREENQLKSKIMKRMHLSARWADMLAWLKTAVYDPLADFFTRPSALLILVFILVYKLCDAYIGMMANPFYAQMGFSEMEVFTIVKGIGITATFAGIFAGGLLVAKLGLYKSLFYCAILQILSNFVFAAQALIGYDTAFLTLTITVENFTGALGTIAFVSYLSSLCNVRFTATQYALLSSLMAVPRDMIQATSGYLAEATGWVEFFIISGFLGLPAILLLWILKRRGLFTIRNTADQRDLTSDILG